MTPVLKLTIERMSQTMTQGGMPVAVANLVDDRLRKQHLEAAQKFVADAIKAVRSSPDADPKWTDDDIAQQVLDGLEKRRAARSPRSPLPEG